MLKTLVLGFSMALGATAFTMPAYAGDNHGHGHKVHKKHHHSGHHHHSRHRRSGLSIGLGEDGIVINKKRRHHHHHHRRHHHHD